MDSFLRSFYKKYGRDKIRVHTGVEAMSTGILSVDFISGVGGFPLGRMIEIFGEFSSGKSCLALRAMAEASRTYGRPSAYFDLESATPDEWMETLGIDLDQHFFPEPDDAEEALAMVEDCVSSGEFAYIIIDSVPALVPKEELDGSMSDMQVGLQARIIGKGIRKLLKLLKTSNTCLIWINQIRMKVGGRSFAFGPQTDTPGGKAIKFFSSQRYKINKKAGSTFKRDGDVAGHIIQAKTVKNKVGPPYRTAEFRIDFARGVDDDVVQIGLDLGVIVRRQSTYCFDDRQIRGKEAFKEMLEDEPDVKAKLAATIKASLTGED